MMTTTVVSAPALNSNPHEAAPIDTAIKAAVGASFTAGAEMWVWREAGHLFAFGRAIPRGKELLCRVIGDCVFWWDAEQAEVTETAA